MGTRVTFAGVGFGQRRFKFKRAGGENGLPLYTEYDGEDNGN